MKVMIQIPCWNEQLHIKETLQSIPRQFPGVDSVMVVVVDDGSDDDSIAVAKAAGADSVITQPRHVGLAGTFQAGIEYALAQGADILINTDADLQYPSEDIDKLITPLVENQADIVIGDRLSHMPPPFTPWKMFLERLGSRVVRMMSGTTVSDAASGFRAFTREVMLQLVIHGAYSYTLESLMLAGAKRFRIKNVTIPVNKPKRKSRLFRNIFQYMSRSMFTILRAFLMYHPLQFFLSLGFLFLLGALALGVRFLYFFLTGGGQGHLQSLILLSILAFFGMQSIIVGLVADVVAANRRLLEDLRSRMIIHANTDTSQ